MKKIGLIVLGILGSILLHAQEELLPARRFDLSNGLPAKLLYHIIKDKEGFLWLACENGVFLFDGQHFYPYTVKEGLCDNEIVEILPDSRGNIWCAGYNAKISVIQNGSINTRYPAVVNWKGSGFANSMTEDDSGNVYFAGMYGINHSQILKIRPNGSIEDLGFQKIFFPIKHIFFKKGKLYIFGYYSMYEYEVIRKLGEENNDIDALHQRRDYRECFVSEEYKTVWGYKEDKIFELLSGDTLDYRISENRNPTFIGQIDNRHLIISYIWGETILYDLVAKTYRIIRIPPQGRVVDATLDNQENLWLLTATEGLYLIRHNSTNSGHKPLPEIEGNILGSYKMGNRKFAFNSQMALFVWQNGNKVQHTRIAEGKDQRYCTFLPHGNGLLICTATGLFNYSPEKGLGVVNNRWASKDAVLYKDSIFFYRHALRLASIPVDSLPSDKVEEKVIYADRAYSIALHRNRLWASTTHGLISFDIPTQTWTPPLYEVPGNGRIEDIVFWGDRVVALASSNNGVLCLDARGQVRAINITDGLFDNDCKQIVPYQNGWLVRHAMGLSLINLYTGEISTVSRWRELAMSTVNNMYVFGDSVQLASSSGLWEMGLESLFSKFPEQRKLRFLRVVSENNILPSLDNIVLGYADNQINVEFALPEYNEPNFVQYTWRINGGEWNKADGTSLEFVNLPPGDYVLQVKAKASGFDWSSVSELRVRVAVPFWRTWLFMVSVALGTIGIVWMLVRRRYRRKLAQEREKASVRHQLMAFEQKALNAMMNPHFVFNAMGSIQHLLNTGKVEQANDYLVKFSRLIRKSLETSQQEFCYLDDEIERLTLYLQLEKMRFGSRMVFRIEVDETLDAEQVKIPTMILQTYVENAIIHGVAALRDEATVHIAFLRQKDMLRVVIDDNGPGFNTYDKAKRSVRFGLSATEKRLELLTQITGRLFSVSIQSPMLSAGGTRVELKFSIQQ